MNMTYDVIVVGAGVVGSAAAYQAAKAGHHVLLLEQFEIDHQMGSSYGYSRIIRYVYDQAMYVEMAKSVFPMWAALEAECGERLYVKTGGIDFGRPNDPTMREVVDSLTACDIPFEQWSPDETQARYPQFRLGEDMIAVYQSDSGVLRASQCVRAQVHMAKQFGATVVDQNPVTKITLLPDSVSVTTPQGTFSAAKLILVPGGWGKSLFASVGVDLPLQPVKCQENYFHAAPEAEYEAGRFPVFIARTKESFDFMPYGLPSIDGSGLKVGIHGGAPFDPTIAERIPEQSTIEAARQFMQQHIPGGNGALMQSRVCLYTMTPDEDFVIDTHPEHSHIVICASCSGHAFKFGPLLGAMVTDLAFTGTAAHDLTPFRASRFTSITSN